MPAEAVGEWLESRRPALIDQMELGPIEHSALPGTPLSIQRGQAEAFCLQAPDGGRWILKKFLPGKSPDRSYLEAVRWVLPQEAGFEAGTARQVLSSGSLCKSRGCHYSPALAEWLDGTVLMPRIKGVDWATVADELREGRLQLEPAPRLAFCRGLSELVASLEQVQCAHRDFSSGNVFIDAGTCTVCLIDFDSLYHASLPMPEATTCGTEGYAAPFEWKQGEADPAVSWCPHADRFGLALLNAEFLILEKGSVLEAEGGMFKQQELRARAGQGLDLARRALRAAFPSVLPLFDAALASENFEECPSPQAWEQLLGSLSAGLEPPRLSELEEISATYFEQLLAKRRPAAPLWPAPSLRDLPDAGPQLACAPVPAVSLPPDPWSSDDD